MPGHPSGTTSRRVTTSKRVVSTSHLRRPVKLEEPEVEAVGRIAKKRRTSSVGPDDADQPRQGRSSLEESALAKETAAIEEVKWEDLDKEDEGDPLMVSEYVVDIFQYLLQLEQQTMPNPNYIDTQRDLAWKMRGILMDWLIQVHGRFRLLPETLFLAVNIVDRFLSARTVSLVRLQLVGITAIFIAAKYEEIMAPSLHNFIYCSDSTYEEKDIIEAEKYILKSLDWNLSYPNPIHFLRRASKADNYDLQVRTVAKYLIEISCVDWRLLPYPPSAIAAAGMWLARLILEKEEWTPNLEHYSGYSEEALLPGAQIMLAYLLRAVRHESFYKKYAAKKYMKVSAYVRDWAWAKFGAHEVDYDEEGEALTGIEPHKNIVPQPASITLFDVLPRLREEARLRKEAEKAAEDELGVLHEEDEE
ncbi:A/B/D/E cyclin [Cantharellus anzutake]|uniref:A/B/D/E cyclin n=1 Tax=Cantharellus anzutake TaxID=1750568 RepID=UPI0019044562|nr:A/B/D/E cyclin [Cantharellus anzutake]KAF8327746.1 A/B/D/E cyclin [Cantharellus anzutake]